MEEISRGNVKIIPDLIISGGEGTGDGSLSGLMGLQLLQMLREQKSEKPATE
jgi:hypothetical protein